MVSVGDAIRIAVTANGTQAVSEFKKVGAAADQNLKKAEAGSRNLGLTLTKVGVASSVAGLAIGAGLFKAAQAASDADLAQRKLQNTIANQPQLAGASTTAFNHQADALERVTSSSHVQTTTTQALLGQYKLTQSQILQLTPLVIDLSQKMGIDQVSAAKAVGKAVEGSSGSLRRFGIVVDVAKNGTHNLANVTDALRHTVGGFAQQEGKTFTGQVEIIKNELKHAEEQIGSGAIPAFRNMGKVVGFAGDALGKLGINVDGQRVGELATYGATFLVVGGSISFVVGQTSKLLTTLGLKKAALIQDAAATETDAAATASLGAAAATAEVGVATLSGTLAGLPAILGTVVGAAGGAGIILGGMFDRKDISDAQRFVFALKDVEKAHVNLTVAQQGYNRVIAAKDPAKEFRSWAKEAGLTAPQIALVAKGFEEADSKLKGLAPSSQHAAKAIDDSATAAAHARGALSDLNAQILTLIDNERTVAGDQRSAAEAYLKVGDAQSTVTSDLAAYNALVKAGKGNTQDGADALRKYREDVLGVGDAVDTATSSYLTQAKAEAGYVDGKKNSTRANNDFIFALQREVSQTTGPVHDALETYLRQLHKIPPSVSTTVTVDTAEALAALGVYAGQVQAIEAKYGGTAQPIRAPVPSPKKPKGVRAAGGPVDAGERYLVGEQGPELFVPRTSGTIIPNGRMRASGGSGGGGNTYQITVNTLDARTAGAVVVDAIKAYERTNTDGWRRN